MKTRTLFLTILALVLLTTTHAQLQKPFEYLDIFQLEYTGDPQISPDGTNVVYRRTGFDIMEDKSVGNLWMVDADGTNHRKLTSGDANERQARWSPDGKRIAFISSGPNGNELYMFWVATGTVARLSQLDGSPSNLRWSPDGQHLAFTMKVAAKAPVIASMPAKPKGAKWAKPPRITDRLKHEADGAGYVKPGFTHIFTISSAGGTPRQVTNGTKNHGGSLSWSPDGRKIYFSSNINDDWEYKYRNSEVYALTLATETIVALTTDDGPDSSPVVSPDGKQIAYIGFKDRIQNYQVSRLQLMNSDGSNKRIISAKLDRSIKNAIWAADGKGLYVMYDDFGKTKIEYMDLNGNLKPIVENVGGTTLGRPYASGSFTVSENGTIAYTLSHPDRPADVGLVSKKNTTPKQITTINSDLFKYRSMGAVEEIWYTSSFDGRKIQGWMVYPPNYNASKKYPLLVENHGGPVLNYGNRFSAEIQLYAAAGYVVFYPNPRGSTSYGEEFGNLLYNNYPGEDYNDVMDGVDAVIAQGKVDATKLYVTGGSAGGIMTAWMIGKNNRFKAAVVAKPVMNWISKTLVADNYFMYTDYRYPGQPWENYENYWKFSPISLVGNIETPTMVMVGMNDLRTPPSEAKQLYHALKIQKKETVLVEIPDASHGIASRPSNLITKVAHTLAWFEKFK